MVTVEMLRISSLVRGAQAHLLTQRRLSTLVELGLVIVLAIVVADLVTGLLAPQTGSQTDVSVNLLSSPSGTAARAAADNRPSTQLKALFGVPAKTSLETSPYEEELQETQLNLKLKGILVDSLSRKSIALIALPSNAEEIYRVGDEVEGAEIIRIEPRRVVIRRNGISEALYLEIPEVDTGRVLKTEGNSGLSRNGIRKLSDTERVVSQQSLRQQLNNLPRLLQQARAVPHTVNGQNLGFKLVEIQAGSVFEDLGLQKEDVVQSVNGTALRSPEDALKAYRELRTSKSFQVALLRRGNAMTLNLTVQ